MHRNTFIALGMVALFFICFFVQFIAEAKQSSTKSSKIVIHHPDKAGVLTARWKWAMAEAEKQKLSQGFWIGYSIEREMMQENHHVMGEVWITGSQVVVRGIPLIDLIESKEPEKLEPAKLVLDDKRKKQPVSKQIALLFEFYGNASFPRLKRVGLSDITMPVSLRQRPLFWLGPAEIKSSLELVRNFYDTDRDAKFDCSLADIIEVHGLLDK
ncbi:hypothetical protein L0337_20130 [candidate division KSB1 bacterium]|nr:hypothetical protein [candidate division KSB1 bacterium]